MKNLTQAEIKQRQDAAVLLQNAIVEREEYVKIALRLENNLRTFVERQNFELASLARTIAQKEENIATLKKIVDGFFVEPTPPVISQAPEEKQEVAKEKGFVTGELAIQPAKENTNGKVIPIANPAKDGSDAEVAH